MLSFYAPWSGPVERHRTALLFVWGAAAMTDLSHQLNHLYLKVLDERRHDHLWLLAISESVAIETTGRWRTQQHFGPHRKFLRLRRLRLRFLPQSGWAGGRRFSGQAVKTFNLSHGHDNQLSPANDRLAVILHRSQATWETGQCNPPLNCLPRTIDKLTSMCRINGREGNRPQLQRRRADRLDRPLRERSIGGRGRLLL